MLSEKIQGRRRKSGRFPVDGVYPIEKNGVAVGASVAPAYGAGGSNP
jgi:hypothetical protein